MPEISVETFAVTDLEDFIELSRLEYGPSVATNADHIRWKHLDSPFGASTYVSLAVSGKTVGRALLQPRPMCTASRELNVACVTDVLIDREFRSPPTNFIGVAKAMGNVSRFDVVCHTSNERTNPLYSKLLHFPTPFSLLAYGFPLRAAGFLSVITRCRVEGLDWLLAPLRWLIRAVSSVVIYFARLDVSPLLLDDDELAVLCGKCLCQSGPFLARTNAFLKWRFADAPLSPATVYRVGRDAKFIGYIATNKSELGGLRYLILMDFLLDPDAPALVRISLRLWLIRSAITSKVDALFTMVNSFSSIARICTGFPLVSIPDALLPHATPIFIRCRSNDSKEFETDRSIHFTLADLDYF